MQGEYNAKKNTLFFLDIVPISRDASLIIEAGAIISRDVFFWSKRVPSAGTRSFDAKAKRRYQKTRPNDAPPSLPSPHHHPQKFHQKNRPFDDSSLKLSQMK